jgi:hypothetical protein
LYARAVPVASAVDGLGQSRAGSWPHDQNADQHRWRSSQKEFPVEQYPKFLVLPQLHDPPGVVSGHSADGNFGRVSFSIWGDEEELRVLNAEGNAILVDGYNLDSFGRMLAKMAHGYAAGQLRLENFDPLLPDFILGRASSSATYLIGNWGEDGMAVPSGVIHQIGHSFRDMGNDKILIAYGSGCLLRLKTRRSIV